MQAVVGHKTFKSMERYTFPWIGKLSIVKMSVCSKLNHKFTEIPLKLPKRHLKRVLQNDPKIHLEK